MSDLTINQLAGVPDAPGAFEVAGGDLADRDTFLKLLTTQLSNQDPTSPMENEQFLSQLAQFSSLEQLMGMQSTMQAVFSGIQAMNNASMANLLGTEVTAVGNEVAIEEGEGAPLGWANADGVTDATLTIRDADGSVVRTVEMGLIDNEGTYEWDGKDNEGNALPAGNYTFSIDGTNADNEAVFVETRIVGIVDGMDYSSGSPQPFVNGVPVDLGNLITLRNGDSA
ncbi:MAG: flagellar hook assembly protein FlgD [Myxococcota bacterium]